MKLHHRGQLLSDAQLDAIMPALRDHVHGRFDSFAAFEQEVDRLLEAAGLPLPPADATLH